MDFPLEIDAIRYEGKNVSLATYNILGSKKISILRNESKTDWFDVWISQSPAADRQLILGFKITEMYSMVVKVLSTVCESTLNEFPLNIQMHFHSKDELKKFRYDEIFMKITRVLTFNELREWPVSIIISRYKILYCASFD